MIGAMHLGVTVHAAATEQEPGWRSARQSARVMSNVRVTRLRVTALTQQGRPLAQHPGVIRAVGRMALGTVFGNGCVLPEKRAALFRVTLIAGLIHSLSHQLQLDARAVRAVARSAAHLARAQRV